MPLDSGTNNKITRKDLLTGEDYTITLTDNGRKLTAKRKPKTALQTQAKEIIKYL